MFRGKSDFIEYSVDAFVDKANGESPCGMALRLNGIRHDMGKRRYVD